MQQGKGAAFWLPPLRISAIGAPLFPCPERIPQMSEGKSPHLRDSPARAVFHNAHGPLSRHSDRAEHVTRPRMPLVAARTKPTGVNRRRSDSLT